MMKNLNQEQNEKVKKLVDEVVLEAIVRLGRDEKIMKRVSKDRLDSTRNVETTFSLMQSVIFELISEKVDYKKETDIHTALENSNIIIAKKIHELI